MKYQAELLLAVKHRPTDSTRFTAPPFPPPPFNSSPSLVFIFTWPPPAERGGSQCPISVVVTIVVFFSFSEQLIILLCERKAGSYGFHHVFLAHKGSLSSIIQTEQINNNNTLTTSCYQCKFNSLNLPDILARSLSSKFCFLILALQYLYGQTRIALLIQTERFHKSNWQYFAWCGPSLYGSSSYGRGRRWASVSKKWGGRPAAGVVLAVLLVFAAGCSCLSQFPWTHELS